MVKHPFAKLFKPVKTLFSWCFCRCHATRQAAFSRWEHLKYFLLILHFIFSIIWITFFFPSLVLNPSIFGICCATLFLIFGCFAIYYSLLYEPKNRGNYHNNNHPQQNSEHKNTTKFTPLFFTEPDNPMYKYVEVEG